MIPNGLGACARISGGVDGVGGELGAHAQHRRVGGEQAPHPVLFFGGIVVPVPDESGLVRLWLVRERGGVGHAATIQLTE